LSSRRSFCLESLPYDEGTAVLPANRVFMTLRLLVPRQRWLFPPHRGVQGPLFSWLRPHTFPYLLAIAHRGEPSLHVYLPFPEGQLIKEESSSPLRQGGRSFLGIVVLLFFSFGYEDRLFVVGICLYPREDDLFPGSPSPGRTCVVATIASPFPCPASSSFSRVHDPFLTCRRPAVVRGGLRL